MPRGPIAQAWRVSPLSFGGTLPVQAHDSFVPLGGEGQRRPGPPLEVACLQTTTNFLDPTNSPTGHRPCIENNRQTSQTDNFTSKKSSRPRQPHRPSWHSWRDASTCVARSPASWTWV